MLVETVHCKHACGYTCAVVDADTRRCRCTPMVYVRGFANEGFRDRGNVPCAQVLQTGVFGIVEMCLALMRKLAHRSGHADPIRKRTLTKRDGRCS